MVKKTNAFFAHKFYRYNITRRDYGKKKNNTYYNITVPSGGALLQPRMTKSLNN